MKGVKSLLGSSGLQDIVLYQDWDGIKREKNSKTQAPSLFSYDNFVKAKRLPRVDFFIPDQKLIVEFDESQHFTEPRAIALGLYPNKDDFGFSLEKWSNLCRDLDKRDNDPPYRDEQRAWYDTLRDFVPLFWGAGQTVRLYSRDFVWCSLDPKKESDLQTLRQLEINKKDLQG